VNKGSWIIFVKIQAQQDASTQDQDSIYQLCSYHAENILWLYYKDESVSGVQANKCCMLCEVLDIFK
jgi:hypothetical protein